MRNDWGYDALASLIRRESVEHAPAVSLLKEVDLGDVLADGSLQLHTREKPLRPHQFYLAEWLTVASPLATTESVVVGDHGAHDHDVPRPAALGPLAPGDRVLCVWATAVDVVVMCRVARP